MSLATDTRVAGVPPEAALPLAVVAFATMSVPPEWRRVVLSLIETLHARRDWLEATGAAPELLLTPDREVQRLEKQLRPPLWMSIEDVDGKPTLHFKQLTDGTGTTKKREPELGAFVYQAVGVLEAFGCPLRRRIRDEQKAATAGKDLPRPAAEIVSVLLGIVGLTPNAHTNRRRRTASTVVAEYKRQKRSIPSGAFTVSVAKGKQRGARLANGKDIVDFIAPGVQAVISDSENYRLLRRRLWIPSQP